MAKINLAKFSVKELKELVVNAERALAKKEKQEERAFLREMKAKARKLGLDLEKVVGRPAKVSRKRRKRAKRTFKLKYRNPKNRKETWTGVGRAPKWAEPYKKAGKLDEVRIKS